MIQNAMLIVSTKWLETYRKSEMSNYVALLTQLKLTTEIKEQIFSLTLSQKFTRKKHLKL